MKNKLINPPLVEALIELRWNLNSENNIINDPNYNFLLGMFFEKIKNDYPLRINLPFSNMPPELIPYSVQYQFRKKENEWPVVQMGLGLLTNNILPNELFLNNKIKNEINGYDFQFIYPLKKIEGNILFKFTKGKVNNKD